MRYRTQHPSYRRRERGFLDFDIGGLVMKGLKLIPAPALPWVLGTLGLSAIVGLLLFQDLHIKAMDAAFAAHRREHAALDARLDKIADGVADIQRALPAITVEVADAKAQADRANARLDGAEADPAYAGRR